ncbi:33502_t:CDS:2, partial [Gigaspora margarita]
MFNNLKMEHMEHIHSLLAKRTKKCPNVTTLCRCKKQSKKIEDCEKCKNRPKCEEEAPLICNGCLHEVLEREFDNWSSENVQIDEFVRNAQRSLSYIRYPEWIPYNSFTEIKCVNRGEFGAVISAKWNQGTKAMQTSDNVRHYFRSDPCAVVLKKLKDMNQLSLIKIQHQDPKNCCNLYGITQDLSTLEYMLVEPTSVCDGCLSNQLKGEKDTVHLFLKEIKAQFNCCHLYGVTKDPSTSQYMFVMRYAPQGDLRRFLQKNFDQLTLENKLAIAQSICVELQNIHAKGWVHGDLHGGNILLLNEEDAFISDFGLCRPTNETKMLEKKIYG